MLNEPLSCVEGSTLLTAGLDFGHCSRATLVAKCLEAGELVKHSGNVCHSIGLGLLLFRFRRGLVRLFFCVVGVGQQSGKV